MVVRIVCLEKVLWWVGCLSRDSHSIDHFTICTQRDRVGFNFFCGFNFPFFVHYLSIAFLCVASSIQHENMHVTLVVSC